MTGRSRAGAGPVGAFAARLVVIAGIFLLAIALHLRGLGPYSETQLTALYALVLVAFLVSLAYGVLAANGRAGPRVLGFELAGDWVLITALVYCTGGVGSLFGFLYILSIVHAAARAGPRETLYASVAAISAFGVVAFGTALGWLPTFEGISAPPLDEAATAFGIQTAACLSVTLLARRLGREVEAGQDELLELGELHQRIVDNVSSGLLTVDRSEHITSFNREAERITGYRIDQVMSWPLERLFPTLAVAPVSMPDGGITRVEAPFTSPGGEELYLGFSRSLLRDARGRPDGAILIFQDLTRVREMEEQLRRSERLSAVGQLATGLAHEIRNPLASLSGAIELLGADLQAPDANSRRLLRIVERETARLNRLVSEFLSYAGRRQPQRQSVPLKELLEEIRALFQTGEYADVTLAVEVAADATASADADQLRQVFWNLILNAAQSEPADQRVVVRAYEAEPEAPGESQRIRIEVSDRGAGIADQDLERAFEPFFTTRPKGTGLGLATVHRVIEAHGGELAVASEVGKGTTVSVTLDRGDA